MVRIGRNKPPLDAEKLEEMALAYVARFATTKAKLEAYLNRKLHERGWSGDSAPPLEELINRMISIGYVDDSAFAQAKSGGLLRRGYGQRRIDQALHAAGIDESVREQIRPNEAQQRQAALTMAKKRGFGPFGGQVPDRRKREKQLAAMLRAGHSFENSLALIDASDGDSAETWAYETEETD